MKLADILVLLDTFNPSLIFAIIYSFVFQYKNASIDYYGSNAIPIVFQFEIGV